MFKTLAFAALFMLATITPVKATHVIPNEEVTAFMFCDTIEDAVRGISLLMQSKNGIVSPAYRDFIYSAESTCYDTRSIGQPNAVFVTIRRIPEKDFSSDRANYRLWEAYTIKQEVVYLWEGDPLGPEV